MDSNTDSEMDEPAGGLPEDQNRRQELVAMATLLYLRAVNSGLDFQLASNADGAGVLGDLIFRVKPADRPDSWVTHFVHLHHGQTEPQPDDYVTPFAAIKESARKKQFLFDGGVEDFKFVVLAMSSHGGNEDGVLKELESQFFGCHGYKFEAEHADGFLLEHGKEDRFFMKKLPLNCYQVKESLLASFIDDEMTKFKAFTMPTSKPVFLNNFSRKMSNWWDTDNTALDKGSDLVIHAWNKTMVESCSVVQERKQLLNFKFTEEVLRKLREHLNPKGFMIEMISDPQIPRMSCTKLLQAITGPYLFLSDINLMQHSRSVISEWETRKDTLLLIIMTSPKVTSEHLAYFVTEMLEKHTMGNKMIILSVSKDSLRQTLPKNVQESVAVVEDTFDPSQLDTKSQEKFKQQHPELQPRGPSADSPVHKTAHGDPSSLTGVEPSKDLPRTSTMQTEMASKTLTYKKVTGFATTKGVLYEVKMIAIMFLRGVNSGLDFKLASNVQGAGTMDDVVFRFKDPQEESAKWTTLFVHLKHREGKNNMISLKTLTEKCFLPNYCESHQAIKTMIASPDRQTLFSGCSGDWKVILFTNAVANKNIGPVSAEPVDPFLATGSGIVHFFDPEGTTDADKDVLKCLIEFGDDGKDFMAKFRLYSSQPSEDMLDGLIEVEINKIEKKSGKIDIKRLRECFVEEVKLWCEQSNEILHKGSDILLKARHRVTVEVLGVEAKKDTLMVSFQESALAPLKDALKETESVLHVEASEGTCLLSCTKALAAIEGPHLFLSLQDLLENKEAVKHECQRAQTKFLVISAREWKFAMSSSYCSVVSELRSACKSLRIVIISSGSARKIWIKSKIPDLICLDDTFENAQIQEEMQKVILKKELTFQGHVSVLSDSLGKGCVLNAESVVEILKSDGKLTVGSVLADEIGYYVDRTLERATFLKRSILYQALTDSISVVNMLMQDIQTILLEGDSSLTPESVEDNLEKLSWLPLVPQKDGDFILVGERLKVGKFACNFLSGLTSSSCKAIRIRLWNARGNGCYLFILQEATEQDVAHLVEFQGSKHTLRWEYGKLYWRESSGNMEIIREHLDENQEPETMSGAESRLMLICAEPGMGKSTQIAHIAKQAKRENPDFWIIALSLNDHTELFYKNKHNDALGFLSAAINIKSALELLLLKDALEVTGKITVLLDGFDEIAPRYVNQCCIFLSNLCGTKIEKIWLTSRKSIKTTLEDRLSTLAASLRRLDKENQRQFLRNIWADKSTLSEEDLEAFISQLLEKTSRAISNRERDFLGIPLQLQIMAHVLEDHVTGQAETTFLPVKLNILSLLETFVDKKIDIFVQDKLQTKKFNPEYKIFFKTNKTKCIEDHSNAALVLILNEEYIKDKYVKSEASLFFEDAENLKHNTGIIERIVNGKPRFVHRIFAEYFVAIWLTKNYAKMEDFLHTHFNEADFEIVRIMFDRMLARDSELNTAVLDENVERVRASLDNGVRVISKDQGGRTALHLAAAFGPSKDAEENKRRNEILDLLIERISTEDFKLKDEVHKASPLLFADMTQSWSAIEKLLPRYNESDTSHDLVTTSKKNHVNHDFVKYISRYNLKKLTEFSLKGGLSVKMADDNTGDLRSILVSSESIEVAALLLKASLDHLKGLHKASAAGDLEKVQHLVSNSIHSVNEKDELLRTALHYAAGYQHAEVVTYLISQGADLKFPEESFKATPLHAALLKGKTDIVKILVEAVSESERFVYITTWAVYGASGASAFHVSAAMGHVDVVRYLLDAVGKIGRPSGSDEVNVSNIRALIRACNGWNMSSVDMAVQFGHPAVLKVLLEAFDPADRADLVNHCDNGQRNAMQHATHAGNVEVMKLILEADVSLNADTNVLQRSLTIAEERGHTEMIKFIKDKLLSTFKLN